MFISKFDVHPVDGITLGLVTDVGRGDLNEFHLGIRDLVHLLGGLTHQVALGESPFQEELGETVWPYRHPGSFDDGRERYVPTGDQVDKSRAGEVGRPRSAFGFRSTCYPEPLFR